MYFKISKEVLQAGMQRTRGRVEENEVKDVTWGQLKIFAFTRSKWLSNAGF